MLSFTWSEAKNTEYSIIKENILIDDLVLWKCNYLTDSPWVKVILTGWNVYM